MWFRVWFPNWCCCPTLPTSRPMRSKTRAARRRAIQRVYVAQVDPAVAKAFEPADIERRWYPEWESRNHFAAGVDASKQDNFCILLPPPNVTGTLHMGHGFNQAIMDFGALVCTARNPDCLLCPMKSFGKTYPFSPPTRC